MGLLDTILEMQSQGLSYNEIVENLRQQGFTPVEISDALSQLKVREAVSQETGDQRQEYDQYRDEGGHGVSSEAIGEMVEHFVSEKIEEIEKKIASFVLSSAGFEERLRDIDTRLKKVEESFEGLQRAVLGKVGEYGKDLKGVREEMGMMQESFSKVLNPLVDLNRKLGKVSEKRGGKETGEGERSEEKGFETGEGKDDDQEEENREEEKLSREHFNFDVFKKVKEGK